MLLLSIVFAVGWLYIVYTDIVLSVYAAFIPLKFGVFNEIIYRSIFIKITLKYIFAECKSIVLNIINDSQLPFADSIRTGNGTKATHNMCMRLVDALKYNDPCAANKIVRDGVMELTNLRSSNIRHWWWSTVPHWVFLVSGFGVCGLLIVLSLVLASTDE